MALLILMLKTTLLSDLALKKLWANDDEIVGADSKADEMIKNVSKSKKLKNTKSEILMRINNGATGEPTFLTSNAKKAFNLLR